MSKILYLLIPVLAFGMIFVTADVDALKSKGNSLTETNSKKVCGDRLCSEIDNITPQITESTTPVEDMPESNYTITNFVGNLHLFTNGEYNSMFITTGDGTIVFDAPENFGEDLVNGIQDYTDEPITHLVYSHAHKDHIGAAHTFSNDVIIVAHEETKTWLERSNDSQRPLPHITFSDNYELVVGDTLVELSYKGPVHSKGNIFSYVPEHKTLFLVDHVHPGWVPFYALGVSEDVRVYIDAHQWILDYDFEYFVPGHGYVGDREDVELIQEYIFDLQNSAYAALEQVDFVAVTSEVDPIGYNTFAAYLDALSQKCAQISDDKWREILVGTDTWTESTCTKILFSIFID